MVLPLVWGLLKMPLVLNLTHITIQKTQLQRTIQLKTHNMVTLIMPLEHFTHQMPEVK